MDYQKKIEELKKKMEEEVDGIEELDKAQYIFEIGKIYKEQKMMNEAISQFKETISKTISFNRKIEAIFEICHIGLLEKNLDLLKEYLQKIKDLLKEGGDWEKKNRLKVYEGLYLVLIRNFKEEKEKKDKEEKEKEKEEKEPSVEKKEIKKHGAEEKPKDERYEIRETVREMNRKRNYTHNPRAKKRFKISEELVVTEINTSSPVVPQNLSFSIEDCTITNSQNIFLFGIDRNDLLHIFDIKKRRWSKKKILEIEDISDTFQKDYQYEGTILYKKLIIIQKNIMI